MQESTQSENYFQKYDELIIAFQITIELEEYEKMGNRKLQRYKSVRGPHF